MQTSHIGQERLMALALDEAPVTEADINHLAECTLCRQTFDDAMLLVQELNVARQSTPSAAALERYAATFESAPRRTESLMGRVSRWVQAQLALDSRVAPLAAGVRSGRAGSYRMLFTSEYADVDVLVEEYAGVRRLEGEYMEMEARGALPVLVQLQDQAAGRLAAEAESDMSGRFRLSGLQPGQYSLIITDQAGEVVEVKTMEIT